jgi:hypothetical protein
MRPIWTRQILARTFSPAMSTSIRSAFPLLSRSIVTGMLYQSLSG